MPISAWRVQRFRHPALALAAIIALLGSERLSSLPEGANSAGLPSADTESDHSGLSPVAPPPYGGKESPPTPSTSPAKYVDSWLGTVQEHLNRVTHRVGERINVTGVSSL